MKTINKNQKLFDLTMKNVIKVGNKELAYIPIELLFADMRFQRTGNKAKRKIQQLAAAWDFRKMDALRVVVHPETCNFSVIDGWHRYSAAKLNGEEYLVCEIIELTGTETERLVEEASLFALQGEQVDPLSPMEKHKANLIRGVKENLDIQAIADKYGLIIAGKERGFRKESCISGFTTALRIARVSVDLADKVFNIICSAGWQLSANGTSNNALNCLFNILKLHRDDAERITTFLGGYLRQIDPDLFFAFSAERYPERKPAERNTLYLEDVVTENLNITRVYNGGTVKAA